MKIHRTILEYIEKNLFVGEDKKKAVVIYGPRQVGKTTLVQFIQQKYPQGALYFNCDYLDVRSAFAYENSSQWTSLVKNCALLILDEAQRIENIGLVLKILVDQYPAVQVVATGSSSFDLSNKINEPLTGRKVIFHLFPFSFEELSPELNPLERKRRLEYFLRFGSYPDVVNQNETDAQKILKELTGSYLFKDVFNFQQLKKPELLTKLLRLLAFQIGQEVSYHELAQQLSVDQTVVQKYIHLLEEAFVIFRLSAFKRNLRGEIAKARKIYFWDLGIRNTLIQNFNPLELRDDVGALWENFCVAERLKFHSNHERAVNSYFWRTYNQKEIDYIEEKEGKLFAFEFKWNSQKKGRRPDEFLETYKDAPFKIIHPDNCEEFIL